MHLFHPPASLKSAVRVSAGFFGFIIQEARQNVGLSIEEAAQLSGMELSEWMAVEDGYVPQDINQLRAMAEAMQINFEHLAEWVLVSRAAWELE